MSKHVAIYARVSSKTQDTASQEPDLKRYEASADLPCVWYKDKASGKTMDRPGWKRLWEDVLSGKVDRIVVWKMDRLGRTSLELLQLVNELRDRGVKLVMLRDGIATGEKSPAGTMFLTMLAAFAQYEREVRAERQLAGIERAKAEGTKRGKPFGRPKVGRGKGKRHTVTTEQEEMARRMKAEGQAVAAIARATGLSRPTVYSILG